MRALHDRKQNSEGPQRNVVVRRQALRFDEEFIERWSDHAKELLELCSVGKTTNPAGDVIHNDHGRGLETIRIETIFGCDLPGCSEGCTHLVSLFLHRAVQRVTRGELLLRVPAPGSP
jgi:hypothetical protein